MANITWSTQEKKYTVPRNSQGFLENPQTMLGFLTSILRVKN